MAATVSLVEIATTEEKLDAVLKLLESLKEEHKARSLQTDRATRKRRDVWTRRSDTTRCEMAKRGSHFGVPQEGERKAIYL